MDNNRPMLFGFTDTLPWQTDSHTASRLTRMASRTWTAAIEIRCRCPWLRAARYHLQDKFQATHRHANPCIHVFNTRAHTYKPVGGQSQPSLLVYIRTSRSQSHTDRVATCHSLLSAVMRKCAVAGRDAFDITIQDRSCNVIKIMWRVMWSVYNHWSLARNHALCYT